MEFLPDKYFSLKISSFCGNFQPSRNTHSSPLRQLRYQKYVIGHTLQKNYVIFSQTNKSFQNYSTVQTRDSLLSRVTSISQQLLLLLFAYFLMIQSFQLMSCLGIPEKLNENSPSRHLAFRSRETCFRF